MYRYYRELFYNIRYGSTMDSFSHSLIRYQWKILGDMAVPTNKWYTIYVNYVVLAVSTCQTTTCFVVGEDACARAHTFPLIKLYPCYSPTCRVHNFLFFFLASAVFSTRRGGRCGHTKGVRSARRGTGGGGNAVINVCGP